MNRPRRWVLASAVMTLVGVIFSAIAFGGTSLRDVTALDRPVDRPGFAPLSVPLGLEASASRPPAGSMLTGGDILSHFGAGRRATRKRRGGSGRMIYTGTDAFEPTLGIDEHGNIFYQGATFVPVPGSGGALPTPTVVVSRDLGRTWDEVTPPTHPHTQDPMLYVDPDTGRAFAADLTFPCTSISHTDDAGQSWTASQACGLIDRQNVFAGPPVLSATVGYPNVVYMCAVGLGVGTPYSAATSCLKSLDGGVTWLPTGLPAYTNDPRQGAGQNKMPGACDGTVSHGVVDSKGVVYLPRGWCGQPYLAISKDEGATWERIQVARNGMPWSGRLYAVETAVAVDGDENIYYFWVARDRLPYLAISSDGGNTFSKPMKVGPRDLKEAWGPKIDVGGTGKIALAYVGSTNAPGGKSPDGIGPEYTEEVTWNGYITTSVDALSGKPRFLTATVNPGSDPIMRGECHVISCGVQLHFIDVVIGPDGTPWTSMVDGCPAPGDSCGPEKFRLGFVGTVLGGPKLR